jgi:nifR3 family TIM-barrel protein
MPDPSKNFWATLPRPFFILAPMEDVTDVAFRRVIAKRGKPHVFFTEFTSADGLIRADERGKGMLLKKLEYGPEEHPIVAQLFSANPASMEAAAALARELGFDGIDINMGCPDRKVEAQGCGAALMKDAAKARELIRAAKRGAGDLPVSVKTRIGYATNELETWLPELLAEDVAHITIHARTRKDLSAVPARWEAVSQAVAIRDRLGANTTIAGNGDVKDLDDARQKAQETGCDGVMLGRAIFGNPWLFSDRAEPPTSQERISVLIEHIQTFDELLTGYTSFAVMKKHFKAYIEGWRGAKELRAKLMETSSPVEAISVLTEELNK